MKIILTFLLGFSITGSFANVFDNPKLKNKKDVPKQLAKFIKPKQNAICVVKMSVIGSNGQTLTYTQIAYCNGNECNMQKACNDASSSILARMRTDEL